MKTTKIESDSVFTDSPPARGQNVLVLDDSGLQRRILALSLGKWGYNVVEACNGTEAFEICKTSQIDIILSDWMMPGMDGLEFCRKFRALERETYGYFILLTSKSEKDEVAHGLDVGADDFLTKPVNSNELKARLQAGERILKIEQQLSEKNKAVSQALGELNELYQRVDRELLDAREFQHSLIPEIDLKFSNARTSLFLQSCGHVGGDMVGMFNVSEDRVGLYAADVSGHGVSSALLTARIAGFLGTSDPAHSLAMYQTDSGIFKTRPLDQVAAALNQRILDEMDTDLYLTIAIADVDLATGKVSLVQAGHPHPAVQSSDGVVKFVGEGGPPIGLVPDAQFETINFQLQAGDKFLLHSDGFTEAANSNGDLLDEDGLAKMLVKLHSATGQELLTDLVWELTRFAEGAGFTDDLSAILLEYDGPLRQQSKH